MANCYPPGQSPVDPGTGKGYCASYNYTWVGAAASRQTAFADSGIGYGCGGSCTIARQGFCTRWGVGGKCYGDPGGPIAGIGDITAGTGTGKGCFGTDIPCLYVGAIGLVFGLMIFGLIAGSR